LSVLLVLIAQMSHDAGPQNIKVVTTFADKKGHKLLTTEDKRLVPRYDKYLSWVEDYAEM